MRQYFGLGLGIIVGTVIGAAAVSGLHAQTKPPLFLITEIDVTNPEELHWAIGSRLMPESGVRVLPGRAVWQLDPRIPPGERSNPDEEGRLTYRADDLVLNACKPYEWLDEFPPVAMNSPELRQRIREKWRHLFVKLP